jgi:hypothetical protein
MRPIRAEVLMGRNAEAKETLGALGTVSAWEDANAIFVKPDWTNLEALIFFLRMHPHIAQRIARNQRDVMVGGGYLSRAAETCYWRALIRGWSKIAVVDEKEWELGEGERFEGWLLGEVGRTSTREGIR